MPFLTVKAPSVSLTSSWKGFRTAYNGPVVYDKPSISQDSRSFSLALLPKGAKILSAEVTATRWGSGKIRTMDGVNGDAVSIRPDRIIPGDSLTIVFRFQALGDAGNVPGITPGSSASFSAQAGWNAPTLTVAYQEPFTCPTAPSSVALNKAHALPGEKLLLSWSGAKAGINVPITGYEIHRSSGAQEDFSLLSSVQSDCFSLPVQAPKKAGSFSFKVRALGTAPYHSGLSAVAARVSVTVTPPSPPTHLSLAPAAQYPGGEALLSFSGAAPGENNPITGYALYAAHHPDGPYAFQKQLSSTASSGQIPVTAPASGSLYLKLATLGAHENSPLSDHAVSLTADLSGTSDFSLDKAAVDAGTPVTLLLSGSTDQGHTLTASIGSFEKKQSYPAGIASLSFTPPLAWLSALPQSETAPLLLKLHTENGGTLEKEILLRCPDAVCPKLSGAQIVPKSSVVPDSWGIYAAGKSQASVTLSKEAEPAFGSPIVSYRISGCGAAAEGATLPLTALTDFLLPGIQLVCLEARDARGRVGKTQIPLSVCPYKPPLAASIVTQRCNQAGETADEGLFALAQAQLLFSSCEGHNAPTCQVAFRKQGEEAWQEAGPLTQQKLLFGGALSLGDNWEIRYTVTDALGGKTLSYDIVTRAQWELHVKKGGGAWAFGGVANRPGALKIYGDLEVMGVTRSGDLFSYDPAENALSIRPWEGTFSFDAASASLYITDRRDG